MSTLRSRRAAFACAVFPILASLLTAQATPEGLIGGLSVPGGTIQRQRWCSPAASLCATGLPGVAAPYAGGTAYDAGRQVIWDSDGAMVVGVSALSMPPCTVVCPPQPVTALGVPATSLVCGLAYDTTTSTLWVIDSTPLLIQDFVASTATCPVPRTRCDLSNVIPATHKPGGVAFSGKYQRVFYTASIFGAGGPANLLFSAPIAAPCRPDCQLQVISCPGTVLGPITGLAFDDCDDHVYLTDGTLVVRFVFLPPTLAGCSMTKIECCSATLVGPYHGLALEPSHPVARGSSCTSPPCPACAALRLVAIGDPILGNASFALQITGAPTPATAQVLIGVGACTPGVPLLCGFFYPKIPPPPLVLPPVPVVGPSCNGVATVMVPIPLNSALCGLELCAQGAIACLGAPLIGIGLTNALDLKITDS